MLPNLNPNPNQRGERETLQWLIKWGVWGVVAPRRSYGNTFCVQDPLFLYRSVDVWTHRQGYLLHLKNFAVMRVQNFKWQVSSLTLREGKTKKAKWCRVTGRQPRLSRRVRVFPLWLWNVYPLSRGAATRLFLLSFFCWYFTNLSPVKRRPY